MGPMHSKLVALHLPSIFELSTQAFAAYEPIGDRGWLMQGRGGFSISRVGLMVSLVQIIPESPRGMTGSRAPSVG